MLLAILTLAASTPSVAVLEFTTRLEGPDRAAVDRSYLSERVRKYVKQQLPEALLIDRENVDVLLQAQNKTLADCEGECEVETGKRLGADLVISGQILRFGESWKLALKLHDTHTSQRLSTEQAGGRTLDELDSALEATVVALMAPVATARGPALVAVPKPSAPGALQAPPPALDLDADLLVAYDKALGADARGEGDPQGAAAAWRALAHYRGKNPYVSLAQARAVEWSEFARKQAEQARLERDAGAALAARRQEDRQKLLKVLPLSSFPFEQKLAFLDQHAARYGHDDDADLIDALPADQKASLCARDAGRPEAQAKLLVSLRQPEFDVDAGWGRGEVLLGGTSLGYTPGPFEVSACSAGPLTVRIDFKDHELPFKLRRGKLSEVSLDLPVRYKVTTESVTELDSGIEVSRALGPPVDWATAQSACPSGWHLFDSQLNRGVYEGTFLGHLPRDAYPKLFATLAAEKGLWVSREGASRGLSGPTAAVTPGSVTSELPPETRLRPLCARNRAAGASGLAPAAEAAPAPPR